MVTIPGIFEMTIHTIVFKDRVIITEEQFIKACTKRNFKVRTETNIAAVIHRAFVFESKKSNIWTNYKHNKNQVK
jgi:hypothetical protein